MEQVTPDHGGRSPSPQGSSPTQAYTTLHPSDALISFKAFTAAKKTESEWDLDLIGKDRIGERMVGWERKPYRRVWGFWREREERKWEWEWEWERMRRMKDAVAPFQIYVCMNVIYENKEWNFEVRVIDLSSLMLV